MIKKTLMIILNIIRIMLFHFLLTFHRIFQAFFRVGAFLILSGSVISLVIQELPWYAKLMSFSIGFMFSLLSYYFDMLVLKLKPDDNMEIMLLS